MIIGLGDRLWEARGHDVPTPHWWRVELEAVGARIIAVQQLCSGFVCELHEASQTERVGRGLERSGPDGEVGMTLGGTSRRLDARGSPPGRARGCARRLSSPHGRRVDRPNAELGARRPGTLVLRGDVGTRAVVSCLAS